MPAQTPQDFVRKWRASTLKERSAAQEHFIDLCHLIGHETPGDDSSGERFTFEAGSSKQKGGQGWADVWKRGFFAWEYKGKHANLEKAYQQLLQYRESLQNPPLLVVSDLESIVVHTNFTNTVKQVTTITLDDLLTPAGLKRLRAIFENPDAFKAPQTTAQVTEAAAREFARLAELLRKWGEDPQRTAHFLIRLLFCLFAEDIGLLPDNLFSRLIARTRAKPAAFAQQLRLLFDAMAGGGWFGSDEIRYFNGRLFDTADVLELDSESLDILARVSALDWSSIEPAILGTLFERSLAPEKRSQLGAHYTSKDDILLIVEPVLMAPLRRRWQAVQAQARELAAKRDAAAAGQRTKLDGDLRRLLVGFAGEIAAVRVLDPACGSGNFLYVALKQLLDLEKEVIAFAGDVGAGAFFPSVSPEQLRGIELNEYAHELAQITVWIGYIQWLRDNGFGAPADPILKPLDTVKRMDAILAFDAEGKPVEPEWPEADVIVGNPPFLGDKKMRAELGDDYVETLRGLYEGRIRGGADLVLYWFERARTLIAAKQARRAGLLSTNSIRSGANREVLERIKTSGDIFMAWADRPWILDGAAVRVSMVGFDEGTEAHRILNGELVTLINSDLTASVDLSSVKQLRENSNICFLGMMKAGPFDLTTQQAHTMLSLPINPNGRSNADVIKRRVGGQDITGRPRDTWIIDFGVDTTEEEAAEYEAPFEYIRKHVKPLRDQNRRETMKRRWWIFGEPRRGLRSALRGLSRCIVTPEVAKHRVFSWIETFIIPDHKLHVFTRDDDYFFGLLQSHVHEVWSLALCSWMGVGNDPSYSSSRTFETFPFPWPPGREPQGDPRVEAIAAAARRLVELRDNWLNPPGAGEAELKKRTLTNLYNQRPAWLDLAHTKLDAAVFAAYGWPADLTDEQILERLLALNLARAAAQGGAVAIGADGEDAE
ncbi:class I SAM-dependent DNA methyltransferase [Kouleothrix sp.]|uniref:class I SAM-dependent DNA methyltransferase n=1 Tax=Kouleothrix sp. TaxID=2779161 RepID=UPI00391A4D7C